MKTFTQNLGGGGFAYHAPELQAIEVTIEQGFAASPVTPHGDNNGGTVDYGGTIGNENED